MKASIIIPIYNVENYLRPCLESVLAQTFQDFEVILVDDGSPDGCGAICDSYAAGDSRFRVIHKENGGLSSARNAGLDVAKGQYVYFLDSDDTISPELLARVIPIMDAGADQVIFQYQRILKDGNPMKDRENITGSFVLSTQEERLSYLLDVLIPCKVAWSACTSIYSMEKILACNQRFQDNRKIFAEDMQFALCYAAHADRIESIDDCLYNYRVRENSIMGVQQTRSNLGRLGTLADSVLSYYQKFEDCSLLTERFPQIYYHLIAGQFTYQMWASDMKPAQYRELVRREVKDWDGMEKQLRTYLSCPQAKKSLPERELRANVLFLLGGSELALRLRCRLLRMLKDKK